MVQHRDHEHLLVDRGSVWLVWCFTFRCYGFDLVFPPSPRARLSCVSEGQGRHATEVATEHRLVLVSLVNVASRQQSRTIVRLQVSKLYNIIHFVLLPARIYQPRTLLTISMFDPLRVSPSSFLCHLSSRFIFSSHQHQHLSIYLSVSTSRLFGASMDFYTSDLSSYFTPHQSLPFAVGPSPPPTCTSTPLYSSTIRSRLSDSDNNKPSPEPTLRNRPPAFSSSAPTTIDRPNGMHRVGQRGRQSVG